MTANDAGGASGKDFMGAGAVAVGVGFLIGAAAAVVKEVNDRRRRRPGQPLNAIDNRGNPSHRWEGQQPASQRPSPPTPPVNASALPGWTYPSVQQVWQEPLHERLARERKDALKRQQENLDAAIVRGPPRPNQPTPAGFPKRPVWNPQTQRTDWV